jgi:hypothetical protein
MTTDKTHTETGDALRRIDRAEHHYTLAFFAAVGVEAVMLLLYLALADFANRTHVLLLVAMVATYTILGVGLVALGAHVNRNTLRILRAVQLVADSRSSG